MEDREGLLGGIHMDLSVHQFLPHVHQIDLRFVRGKIQNFCKQLECVRLERVQHGDLIEPALFFEFFILRPWGHGDL
jgi:hypothetical protein